MDNTAALEKKIRRRLSAQGYGLHKSRRRNTTIDDWGGYMIYDLSTNYIEAGERFNLSLEDVEKFAFDES